MLYSYLRKELGNQSICKTIMALRKHPFFFSLKCFEVDLERENSVQYVRSSAKMIELFNIASVTFSVVSIE